jgi:hypothetical protein
LHQQGLIVFQGFQRFQYGIERLPTASSLAAAPVNNQVLRALSDFGIEVILEHAVGGLGEPGFTGQLCAAWSVDGARFNHVNLIVQISGVVCRGQPGNLIRWTLKNNPLPMIINQEGILWSLNV